MKRLSRKSVSAAAGLLLVMAFAILGMWGLLREEEAGLAPPAPTHRALADRAAPRPELIAALPRQAAALGEAPAAVADEASASEAAAAAKRAQPKAKRAKPKARPALVQGRVVDRAQVGVAGATVRVEERRRRGRKRFSAKTDASGRWRLELPPGRYLASARKAGYAESDRARLRVRDAKPQTLKPLVLPPSSALVGVVSSKGVPLEGARVRVAGRGGHEATSDAEGRFEIDGLREGLYRVTASLDGYVPRTVGSVPVVEDGGGEVELKLDAGGELSGVLSQAGGGALPRGLIFVYRAGRRLGQTRSDEDGRFTLGGLAPGPVELFARSQDFKQSTRTQTEVAAGRLTVQDLTLAAGPQVVGVLRDAQGQPVAGREVQAYSRHGEVRRRAKTNKEGRFRVKDLYPGRYELTVRGTNRRWGEPVLRASIDVAAGPTTRDLTLPPVARVSGVVVDAQGKPVNRANVFAIAGKNYRGVSRTKQDGTFAIRGLAAGEYVMFVRVGNDVLVGRHPLTLTDGAVVEGLQLTVRPPARLAGRVLDPQGQPLAGVVLEVRGGDSPVRRRATSGPDGRFVIHPLYDGEYRLFARSGPLKLLARKWKVKAATVKPFAFAIDQGRDLKRDLRVRAEP